MVGKKRLRMKGIKQTPKRLEDEILGRSKEIADNPGLLRPMCAGDCKRCAFDKPFKEITAISKYKGDEAALLKFASRGSDDLVKAYAGTVSLSAAGKIPLLATATLAGEKVPFAIRGAVGNDKLIGCQYHDDPKIRLLLYNQFIRKNKLHLYSFDGGLVCSNKPNMPMDYLSDSFWDTPYEFKDDGIDCGHESPFVLEIRIGSLGKAIRICEDCAKDVSTLQFLVSRLCAVDPLDDIEVAVLHKYHTEKETGEVPIKKDLLQRYMRGELTDRGLIANVRKERVGTLKSSETSTYLIGSKNFGSDLDGFLEAVTGTDREKRTLRRFLESNPRALILRNGRAAEIFAALWENDWRAILASHTSEAVASSYADRPRSSYEIVLEEAYLKHISEEVLAGLPVFKRPKPMTRLADLLAKAAKVNGMEYVLKVVDSEPLKNTKERSLSAAFVLSLDPDAKPPFNISSEELDFTRFLVPFVDRIILAGGEDYRDAMNTLLTACGSGESV